MTVLPRRAVGACLVAGPALWLSTSVFDRVGTGAGTRVAFFSSWPELAGLTVLVLLTALLLQALAEHLLLRRGIESSLPAWCWAPLVGLAVLAIPFLPWIADRLRVLDALAGPGRWWVWAVAGGQVLWVVATTIRDMLSKKNVVTLDEERKAAMVSNLLVVLCGERNTQPIVNAGTLHD